mmetsp:Transcript_8237/g.12662  ORF Transcript_8237/g.12662 Transcript_8237/m.12662 type:complete len:284 (+) Transcript_8237:114-965(+)
MLRMLKSFCENLRMFRCCRRRAICTIQNSRNGSQQSPKRWHRIILCRHGLSLGNIDPNVYTHTADWRIPLDERGREQALEAGKRLAKLLDGENCFVYHSPYCRTTETMEGIISQLPASSVLSIRSEPRIVEQQFGNFQNFEEVQNSRDERVKFGRFFYRFPSGEAGLDVYNRVTSFISTLFRDAQQMRDSGHDISKTNVVIVTHGLTLRLFLMRWFHIDVNEFENMFNPDNGFLAVMERKTCPLSGKQWYELTEESANHLQIKTRATKPLFPAEDLQNSKKRK